MKRFLAHLIVGLGAALGTAPFAQAEIRIGIAAPLSGAMAWGGEQTLVDAVSCLFKGEMPNLSWLTQHESPPVSSTP
jgi:hypothetical protein